LALPDPSLAWSPSSFDAASERQLFSLINDARHDAGRVAVHWDVVLAAVARSRSRDMSLRGYFDHTIKGTGRHFWDLLDARGYCYNQAGEAIGFTQYWPDAEATKVVFGLFMNSPPHRALFLGRAWDSVGIGAYKGVDDKILYTVLVAAKCAS
jgi:uncharacterized protein YkwD